MIEVKGKANIVVRVVCDSVSPDGVRLTTLECEYPRIIHSEVMTHRMLSRNAASSRAIPFEKMLKQLNGRPVRFGAANKGMQDKGEDFDAPVEGYGQWDMSDKIWDDPKSPEEAWEEACYFASLFARHFCEAGYHKQVYNRLVEPFQMIKTVISTTEWNNFFHLRVDGAADPTIYELARCMKEAMDSSKPQELKPWEWHLPYLPKMYYNTGAEEVMYFDGEQWLYTEQAIKVSAARCAAVSFRNEDYGLEKCLEVYERLVGDERVHASALEHQATPMREFIYDAGHPDRNVCSAPCTWEPGITHTDRKADLWSGNFKGWIQHRQLVANHVKEG